MPKRSNLSQSRYYIGIDPGASGGIAVLGYRTLLLSMPKTERDLFDALEDVKYGSVCIVEKVWGHTGQNQPGSAMFNFGKGYGAVLMALTALGIPFEEVVPRTWQKSLSIPPRKKTETKTQWKNRLKAKAQQLFPNVKVTLATCDALLIAEYCRRKHEGVL